MTLVLGLTGSIGMGKSTTARFFRQHGVAVHDADAEVHRLYAGSAAPLIDAAFPGVVAAGVVDRAKLSAVVLGNAEAMEKLEGIVHPLVQAAEQRFLDAARRRGDAVVVLDVPLLLEAGGGNRCDAIVVVTAPAEVQKARVLGRPGMTPQRFAGILARQLPDAEKRRRAHFIVDTGSGLAAAERQVGDILRAVWNRPGRPGHRKSGDT